MDVSRHWIQGEWVASENGMEAESTNPGSGDVVGRFALGGITECERAIAAARSAFDYGDWARQPRLRSSVLLEFAERMEQCKKDIAFILSSENGKLLREAEHEIDAAISELRYYAGLARNIFSRMTELDIGLFSVLAKEPMGVAGIIVPWNAPITLLIRSLAPAMAAGCTSVVKSAAPQAALANARVFECLAEINNLPPGVVNMVNAGSDVGKLLVASPDVDVISYTGSTRVGKLLMVDGAETLKRMNLELGGSAPCVICADADIDRAVAGIVRAGFSHAGQVCVAASRIIIHESLIDQVQAKLKASIETMKVGLQDDPDSNMGPVIDMKNRDRILNLLEKSRRTGEIIVEGQPLSGKLAGGSFITPSLVRIEEASSPLLNQEVFGPILSLDSYVDEDDAVMKANRTNYGLAASVWTQDLYQGQRIAAKIDSGTVWINAHMRLFAEIETGGYKESGLGRLHGIGGLEEFLQTKHISWSIAS